MAGGRALVTAGGELTLHTPACDAVGWGGADDPVGGASPRDESHFGPYAFRTRQ